MKHTRMLKFIPPLAFVALVAACNEKIAPELADPSAATGTTTGSTTGTTTGSTTGSTTGVATDTNTFRLELMNAPGLTGEPVDPTLLGYTLHKANSAGSVKCEVTNVNSVPDTLDSTRDITCFVEAEEYALFFNGLQIKAVAGPDTCNYISHTPYSFYKLQPGVTARRDGSARQMVFYSCTDDVPGSTSITGHTYGLTDSAARNFGDVCNRYFNVDPTGVIEGSGFSADSPNDLCSFNYEVTLTDGSTREIKCDEGSIDLQTITVSYDSATTTVNSLSKSAVTKCGGNVRACLGGPGEDIVGPEFVTKGYRAIVTRTGVTGGTEQTFKITPDLERGTNVYSANFMRQCSGINFNLAANFNTSVTNFTPGFNPDVLEEYARLGVTGYDANVQDKVGGELDISLLGADPFSAGIPNTALSSGTARWSNSRLRPSPFYTYTCLDEAKDVKARIRVAVREWNRNFSPSSQEFRYVSDVHNLATARMDAGSAQTNQFLIYDEYNDIADWDDLLNFDNGGAGASCDDPVRV